MALNVVKVGNEKYYAVHEDKETPPEIMEMLLKKKVVNSFYSRPYRHYKIVN